MNKRYGFTLIELLVVIAVIAVLMGILMPTLQRARQQASATVCLANIRGTMLAVNTYTQTHDGRLPRSGRGWPLEGALDLPGLLMSEGLDPSRLHCPGDVEKPGALAVWYETTFNREYQDSDYMDGYKPEDLGIRHAHNDFSYAWSTKLFYRCDSPKPIPDAGWKMTNIRYPDKLLVYFHFWSVVDYAAERGTLPHGNNKVGFHAGFPDGHSEYVALKNMTPRIEPYGSNTLKEIAPYRDRFTEEELDALTRYNPDWNKDGVQGRDIE